MPTPTLSTERLTLRALTRATQRNIDWLRDKDVMRFSEQRHREHTLATQNRYVDSFRGRSHIWAITLVGDGVHIGNITATTDEPNNVSDIGIMIGDTRLWGHGYATEAWKAACDWMLDPHCGAIRKLEAGCMKVNLGMLSIFSKCGWTFECERPSHFLLGGGEVSAMYFGKRR